MDTQIITPKEIQYILQKYNIGKKPLAKVLGWGESTIVRYLDGDNPSKEYSDRLLEMKDNPALFYKTLCANSQNITKVAYQKSVKAVYEGATFSKSTIVFYYMKNKWEGDLPMEGYQCLLYFAQGFYMGMYGIELFDLQYKISEQKIPYDELKTQVNMELEIPQKLIEKHLSMKEIEVLEGIMKAVRWYGFQSLKILMTQENDNLKISRNKENERIVSIDTIQKHFQWIIKEYRILRPDDIYKYVDSLYAQIRKWRLLSTW